MEGRSVLASYSDLRDALIWRTAGAALSPEKETIRCVLESRGLGQTLVSQLLQSHSIIFQQRRPRGEAPVPEGHVEVANNSEEDDEEEARYAEETSQDPVYEASASSNTWRGNWQIRNTFLELFEEGAEEQLQSLRRIASAPELGARRCDSP